jgi:hypothetical protein
MGQRGLAHPFAVVPGLDTIGQALTVAGAVAATTRQNSGQSMLP